MIYIGVIAPLLELNIIRTGFIVLLLGRERIYYNEYPLRLIRSSPSIKIRRYYSLKYKEDIYNE